MDWQVNDELKVICLFCFGRWCWRVWKCWSIIQHIMPVRYGIAGLARSIPDSSRDFSVWRVRVCIHVFGCKCNHLSALLAQSLWSFACCWGNDNNILYSSQWEIKALIRSHNEKHISVILNHEPHAHMHMPPFSQSAYTICKNAGLPKCALSELTPKCSCHLSGIKSVTSLLWVPSSLCAFK